VQTLQTVFQRFVTAYAGVAEGIVTFLASFIVLYVFGRFLIEPAVARLLDVPTIGRTAQRSLGKVVHVLVLVAAVTIAIAIAGFGSILNASALVIASLTLAVGFAAQDVVSNLVSGAFIVADQNFNIGDWIEWGDHAGVIDDIGFRVTRIRTFDNEMVTVPNADLATKPVTNPAVTNRLRVGYPLTVGYDEDLGDVRVILLEEAYKHRRILDDPEPIVRLLEFQSVAVQLEVRFWLRDPDRLTVMDVRSTFGEAVKKRFDEAGIELETPSQHDLAGGLTIRQEPGEPPTGGPNATGGGNAG